MKRSTILYTLAMVSFFGSIFLFLAGDHRYSSVMVDLFCGIFIGAWTGGLFFIFGLMAYSEEQASEEREREQRIRELDETFKNLRQAHAR